MNDKTKIHLTSAEMAMLWTQYINDTVSICVNSHFLAKVEDDTKGPFIMKWPFLIFINEHPSYSLEF
jgi:hypothetical protein